MTTIDGTPMSGCVDDVETAYGLEAGDKVVIMVYASIDMSTPVSGLILGDNKRMTGRYEVVIQG